MYEYTAAPVACLAVLSLCAAAAARLSDQRGFPHRESHVCTYTGTCPRRTKNRVSRNTATATATVPPGGRLCAWPGPCCELSLCLFLLSFFSFRLPPSATYTDGILPPDPTSRRRMSLGR
ncbi:hypothetical protein BZA05DRAFT_408481 [Tricharina praecox]|uniref:uncharacterized protein n=1 Tax=Tricharina praecox TaxID=43433 RepID=UPI00221F5EFC|nr:uncharacterized protein BZA05DRAFT_408481 [Tricharina praecox]KAI5845428.1 hypothetical protein BZA05DRAFT_408481 [Tricharina praecox]